MRMVAITQGTYGYKPAGVQHVKPKTRFDEPFELDDAEAARIVGLGIAKYVSTGVATPMTPPVAPNPNDPNGTGGITPDIPEYGDESTAAELRAIGKTAGLTFPIGMTKQHMLDALDEFFASEPDDDIEDDGTDDDPDGEASDDEEPPTPTVEGPVS